LRCSQSRDETDTWLSYPDGGAEEQAQGGDGVRALLQKMTDVGHRVSGIGARLNAMHELDRSVSSVVEVERQLRRIGATSSPRAA
jgi:hypothetical protein